MMTSAMFSLIPSFRQRGPLFNVAKQSVLPDFFLPSITELAVCIALGTDCQLYTGRATASTILPAEVSIEEKTFAGRMSSSIWLMCRYCFLNVWIINTNGFVLNLLNSAS